VGNDPSPILQGVVEMLVLKALAVEPMHCWGLSQQIHLMSNQVIKIAQGSLHPAVIRLRRKGLIRSAWRLTAHNRRARYYSLTLAGARKLERATADWARMSQAVDSVLRTGLRLVSVAPAD